MYDSGCSVTFDGDHGGTYFVPCDLVKYISDKDLSSSFSADIILYRDLSRDHFSIIIPSYSFPYYTDSDSSVHTLSTASNIHFNALANVYRNLDYVYIFVAFIVSVYCLFKLLRGFVR